MSRAIMEFSERTLRGRTAEHIVSSMLSEAGYFVYRFGYEGILQSLVQTGLPKMKQESVPAEKIRTMPDFIVMDKVGEVFFVEVKFQANGRKSDYFDTWLEKAVKHWPEAKILLLHPYDPCFQISTIKDYARTGTFYPLERDKYLKVDERLVQKYGEMIKRYLD